MEEELKEEESGLEGKEEDGIEGQGRDRGERREKTLTEIYAVNTWTILGKLPQTSDY